MLRIYEVPWDSVGKKLDFKNIHVMVAKTTLISSFDFAQNSSVSVTERNR